MLIVPPPAVPRASAERGFECGLAESRARRGCNLRVQAPADLVGPKGKLGMKTMRATEDDSRVSRIATLPNYLETHHSAV